MAIEEKKRALEFTFIPDGTDRNLKYDIVYDERNPAFSLQISTGGNRIDYPLNLFIDVVEFLTSKGIIQPKVYSRTVMGASSPSIPPSQQSLIPMPQVIKGENSFENSKFISNIDPLASFDITDDYPKIPIPNISHADKVVSSTHPSSGTTPPLPTIIKSEGGPILGDIKPVDPIMMPEVVSKVIPEVIPEAEPSSMSSEIISRPVIRSRVTGGDPQSAEKEASMLRASQGKGNGKVIRRAHRAEGE